MNWKLEGNWVTPQNSSDAEDRICVLSGDKAARAVTGPLIAAAPELLAALQMVCDSGCALAEPIENAMVAAIKKATGAA